MAHTVSGQRNIRRNENHRLHNRAIKSALRTQVRRVLEHVAKKDKNAAQLDLKVAYRLLDRAARKGVIHSNAAARHKSRLAGRVSALK